VILDVRTQGVAAGDGDRHASQPGTQR